MIKYIGIIAALSCVLLISTAIISNDAQSQLADWPHKDECISISNQWEWDSRLVFYGLNTCGQSYQFTYTDNNKLVQKTECVLPNYYTVLNIEQYQVNQVFERQAC